MLENIILILFVVIGFSYLFRVNKITGKVNYPKKSHESVEHSKHPKRQLLTKAHFDIIDRKVGIVKTFDL